VRARVGEGAGARPRLPAPAPSLRPAARAPRYRREPLGLCPAAQIIAGARCASAQSAARRFVRST